MFSSKYTWLLIGVAAGYMLSNRLATVPLVNKLPKL